MTPHLLLGGTAMPTGAGIESVLGMLPTLSSHSLTNQTVRSVRWVCLREEPVVYVCHRPFVLRDLARPYSNLEYTV